MKYLATPRTAALCHKQYDFNYCCLTQITWKLFLVNFLTLYLVYMWGKQWQATPKNLPRVIPVT